MEMARRECRPRKQGRDVRVSQAVATGPVRRRRREPGMGWPRLRLSGPRGLVVMVGWAGSVLLVVEEGAAPAPSASAVAFKVSRRFRSVRTSLTERRPSRWDLVSCERSDLSDELMLSWRRRRSRRSRFAV